MQKLDVAKSAKSNTKRMSKEREATMLERRRNTNEKKGQWKVGKTDRYLR